MTPISTVAPVVMAIVGNPVTMGNPRSMSLLIELAPGLKPFVSRTTGGIVTAKISGGCTIGPNRLRR
jgi:hypothetical protein